jgi:(2Fe-2S) ferredoxin
VQLTRTRCVGPCGAAPVVVHYPANDWYWGLRPEQAGALVDAVTSVPADGGTAADGPSGETPPAGGLAGQRVRPS